MVRAPGGQLITRVKTEAAAGKLIADIVDHSDRALMLPLVDLFQDYAPPNAADYDPDALISPKFWPRATRGLVDRLQYRTGEKSAEELDGPDQARIRQDDRPGVRRIRRHHLDPHHVRAPGARRGLLGQAGRDPSRFSIRRARRCRIRWCAARSRWGRCSTTRSIPKQQEGAPVKIIFPPEGVPANPYASGIPKTAAHPNAAKLFLNWCLSKEGQTFMIKELGNLTSLKVPPVYPEGFDPKVVKVWYPEVRRLREAARPLGRRLGQDLRLPAVTRRRGSDIMTATLDVTDLRKQFSVGRPAIDGVSFAVPAGEIVVLLGPFRLRQDHDVALRRRARASDRRRDQHRRARGVVARRAAFWCRRGCAISAWCSSPTRSGRT